MNGKELKEMRNLAGITQKELAVILNAHQTMISIWEKSDRLFSRVKELGIISAILDHIGKILSKIKLAEAKALLQLYKEAGEEE